MKRSRMPLGGMALGAVLAFASPAAAQVQPASTAAADGSSIAMPDLAFTPDDEARRNYFKYFYFHRADTDFATAYADLRECDDYTRDLAFTATAAGGGLLENALANAIFGSGERRMQRRVIMRTCMGFKGYTAYGLRKDLWEHFNFDEGNSSLADSRRAELLRIQARVASGPRPTQGEMSQ